jgi:3-deoxy-D-manno-octulosonic-acid transferase
MRKARFSVGCGKVVMRFLYTLLLYLVSPFVLALLAWRERRRPGGLRHFAEHLGRYAAAPQAPLIWVHAVSVGETRAAEPLVRALQARHPQCRILLTHMTPTGRETGDTLFGARVERCYLPLDFPWAVARFFDRFRPRAGVILETEIWPNLIHAGRARSIPLYLVNARLSEKSYGRYRWFPGLARESIAAFTTVAAQSEDDARRLAALGAADVRLTGNLKFDLIVPPAQLELGRVLRRRLGAGRPVLLAASTREGEEALLLDALEAMAVPGLLTVIVPRHPQRFDEVAKLLDIRGIRYRRRSTHAAVAPETRVLLGDSMGEMFVYYAACDVAFIGGSLVPLGGQNLIEACAVGRPVLIGASTYNFAEAAERAMRAGAAIQVPDPPALAREAERLLRDPDAVRRMSQAALAFASAHRGATARIVELIKLRD